jgi:hypothetical protein
MFVRGINTDLKWLGEGKGWWDENNIHYKHKLILNIILYSDKESDTIHFNNNRMIIIIIIIIHNNGLGVKLSSF